MKKTNLMRCGAALLLMSTLSGCQSMGLALPCEQMKSMDICTAYQEHKKVPLIVNLSEGYGAGEKRAQLLDALRNRGIEMVFELDTVPTLTVMADADQWLWMAQLAGVETIALSEDVNAF